jgi:hypothetical protein
MEQRNPVIFLGKQSNLVANQGFIREIFIEGIMLADHGLWNLVRTEFSKIDIKKEEIKRSEELNDHRIRKLTCSAGSKQAQYFTEEDLMVKKKKTILL